MKENEKKGKKKLLKNNSLGCQLLTTPNLQERMVGGNTSSYDK